MNHWCESCARKNLCYMVDDRPKCFVPITNTASGTPYLVGISSISRDSHEIAKTEPQPTTDCRQTDCYMCKWLGEVDVCGRCRNRNLFAEADTEPKPKDEPTTKTETQNSNENSNLTFETELKGSKRLVKGKTEPQTDYGKSLQLFADILFDKEKSEQFLKECKAMGIEPQTERNSDEDR